MKIMIIVVMLLAFLALANPTLSSHDVETSPKTTNIDDLDESYLQNLQSQVALPEGIRFGCSDVVKREILDKIIAKITPKSAFQLFLKKSAIFVECAASKACKCLRLRIIPPLYGVCLGVVGAICLREVLKHPQSNCILACANNYNGNQLLDDVGIVDLCHNKCLKKIT